MKLPIASVQDAGLAIRALRKHAGIRIDDFALTAKVSKQFMTDLENGKPTVQMGRVLALLAAMGVRLTLEVPESIEPVWTAERAKLQTRTSRKNGKSSVSRVPR